MSWLYLPDTEELNSGSTLPEKSVASCLEQSVTWRSKRSPWQTWLKRWRKVSWMKRLSGVTLPRSTANRGAEKWIASLPESPVSQHHKLERGLGQRMNGGSGLTSGDYLTRFDRHSLIWKTPPELFEKDGVTFSGHWPLAGTLSNGIVSPRMPLAAITSGSGYSLWPLLPTPAATDWKGSSRPGQRRGQLAETVGGVPMPDDVEEIMGLPIGWTALKPLETGSFRLWRDTHLSLLRNALG